MSPERAPKVCAEPGCPNDADRKSGRCPDHQERPWARGSASSRERIPEPLRRAVKRRDRGRCVFCRRPARQVDHRLPVAWGGLTLPENLQLMCDEDHEVKRREEAVIGRALAAGRLDEGVVARHVARWTPATPQT